MRQVLDVLAQQSIIQCMHVVKSARHDRMGTVDPEEKGNGIRIGDHK